jgi:hypothetical protein
MVTKPAIVALFACMIATPVLAQESVGCDKFKWPLDKERALLTSADAAKISSGGGFAGMLPVSATVNLVPFASANLPVAPERAPKSPDTFAGFVKVPTPPQAGTYKISLSSEAWIDVVQDDHVVKSNAFSGALGCEGIRKSVKFDLAAQPFTLQISGVRANSIGVAISGD